MSSLACQDWQDDHLLAAATDSVLSHRPSALEILKQRYARGEIDTVTFENMRERLESSPSSLQNDPPIMSNR